VSGDKVVDVADLWVEYDDVVAVKGVDLSIGPHQVFGLIGPNGAGKTSTLTCLAGVQEPARGAIRIAGVDVRASPDEAKGRIGFVPDFFGVYDNLKVWEYLEFFGMIHGVAPAALVERMRAVLVLTHLEGKRDAYVETLSRGMRQRLCLSRGLIHDPPVLILDEPLSGLDPLGRAEVLTLLRALSEAGKTIVISSHILSDLAEVSTSVGVLEQGQLVYCGAVDQVRRVAVPTRKMRLKLLAGPSDEAVTGALGAPDEPPHWKRAGDLLEVEVPDDDEEAARALERLAGAGIRVVPAPSSRDIEDAFLHLSKGKVS
jgi:ABC-2 type transport system ATP-binding protein